MGISAWLLFTAPYAAPATAPQTYAPPAAPAMVPAMVIESPADDIFSGDATLSEQMMRDAAGGSNVAVTIDNLGINTSENNGLVTNIDVNDSVTGQIANNSAANNSGITTIFNNTGNGVVFQSSVQVNIFLNGGARAGEQ